MSPREGSLVASLLPGDWSVPCAEIDALAEELAIRGARFLAERMEFLTGEPDATCGWHVVYRCAGGDVSVIWSFASYGAKLGLLEAMGPSKSPGDAADATGSVVRGWLSAGDVLRIWPPEVAW